LSPELNDFRYQPDLQEKQVRWTLSGQTAHLSTLHRLPLTEDDFDDEVFEDFEEDFDDDFEDDFDEDFDEDFFDDFEEDFDDDFFEDFDDDWGVTE